MRLSWQRFDLRLRHSWAIASNAAEGGKNIYPVVFVTLTDSEGVVGLGEAAPSSRYQENTDTVEAFLRQVDPARLSFRDVSASRAYLDSLAPGHYPAKSALDQALLDGAARRAGMTVGQMLAIPFNEGQHLTSFSIGIAAPREIEAKVHEAADFPVLKLKLGTPHDRAMFAALRRAAPAKRVRVDANEGWQSKEEALANIEWLAADGNVEFVEQPMPASSREEDWRWLKKRSPLPLFADESYHHASDAPRCAELFHGVNVKLMKTFGITGANEALRAAGKAGLRTMIGCMIESSLLITAGAHLAGLADYLDLDGNLLITNDPFQGVRTCCGLLSFAGVTDPHGLRVTPRPG